MTALMRASRSGDSTLVRHILDEGARVNQAVRGHGAARELIALISWMRQLPRRDAGYRALHYAADGRHAEIARMLLDAGAEVDAVARGGETALWLAAHRGDSAMVDLLLKAGAPVRRPGGWNGPWGSPVAAAVLARDAAVVRMLLAAGAQAQPDTVGRGGTPLITAAGHGDSVIVALLLEHGADPGAAGYARLTPLMVAARGGHAPVVRLLLAAGADPRARDRQARWTAAQWAANGGHDSVVAILERAAPDRAGAADIELLRAVQMLDTAAVRRLLAGGANPNTRTSSGHSLLSGAVNRGSVAIARALIEAGANVRARPRQGETSYLHAAVQRGYLEMSRLLLDAGASAAEPGTATHAAASGNFEVLRLVREAGADAREWSDEPLRAAASAGNVEAVRWLLSNGAQVDASDSNGRTALSRAVAFNQHETVRALLEAGADPRQRAPGSGWTPLMSAAIAGDSAMIVLLINAGADPLARDSEGKTAAEVARRAGKGHVVPLLGRRP